MTRPIIMVLWYEYEFVLVLSFDDSVFLFSESRKYHDTSVSITLALNKKQLSTVNAIPNASNRDVHVGVALIYSLFSLCFKVSLRQQELGMPQHFEHEELVMFNRATLSVVVTLTIHKLLTFLRRWRMRNFHED